MAISRPLELAGRRVDVWPVRLEASDATAAQFQRLLEPEETARAARFRFDRLQRSFILSRGALRILLGGYLGTPPRHIRFLYGPKGKPGLAAPGPLQFNAAHSGALVLFAFTLDCEIGVDVEHIRPLPDMQQIASRFFCAEEAAELWSIPSGQRERAFFSCWTRKEAYLKAVGEGLSAPLDSFRVTLRPGEPVRILHIAQDAAAAGAWTLHNLELGSRYAGSLAYRDGCRPVDVRSPVEPAELLEGKPAY